MEKNNEKIVYLLIRTDGYSIDTERFSSLERAKEVMKEEYEENIPSDDYWHDNSAEKEMSYLDFNDAILYTGNDVFVWRIVIIGL